MKMEGSEFLSNASMYSLAVDILKEQQKGNLSVWE